MAITRKRPSELLRQYREQIRNIINSHGITDIRIFGSVARGKDTINSDLDILLFPNTQISLIEKYIIQTEIKKLLKINVHVVSSKSLSIEHAKTIISEAKPI